ncbi:MAG: hypothetical protein ACLFQA_03560 [Bacteroidales bacterium]
MRRYILLILVIAGISPVYSQTTEQLVDICVARLGDATYLRDFQVELDAAEPGMPQPVAKYSMVLNKNTQYRLSICNSDMSQGQGVIQLFDNKGLIGSNYAKASGTDYPYFDIQIQSTGVYHVFISFKDGLPGTAVGVLSFVKRL